MHQASPEAFELLNDLLVLCGGGDISTEAEARLALDQSNMIAESNNQAVMAMMDDVAYFRLLLAKANGPLHPSVHRFDQMIAMLAGFQNLAAIVIGRDQEIIAGFLDTYFPSSDANAEG